MVRKVRTAAKVLIVAIVVAAFSAISVVQAKTVDPVEELKVSQQGQTESCTLQWKRVSGADGYHVFACDGQSERFEKFTSVDDGKSDRVVLEGLTPSTIYRFRVQAFKVFRNQEYDGEWSPEITAYTVPEKPEFDVSSASAGSMTLQWKADKNASFYQLQYSQDEAFAEANTKSEEFESKVNSTVIDSLTEKSTLNVRIRGCLKVGDSNQYGPWSDVRNVKIRETQRMPDDIDRDKPMVALTFDDGPAFNGATGRILDTLEKYNARATFFMVGSRINNNTKKYLKRELELGCELGNHTYNHNHYGKKVTASDISKCSKAVYKATGKYPTAFRCPGGAMSGEIRGQAKKEGMIIAYWSVDTEDWKSKDPAKIIKRAKDGVYDGSIILMHDIYTTTADAVEKLVPALIEKGYQLVTVSELIQAKTGKAPKAGQQYIDYKTINNDT